ncbi:adenine methyltransferase [Glutamicibacter arilaitensis]|uniref:Adenine methyltransferase n=2 Tax=Glutamicibacter arilaitensis TaxID=256701 RepID=A0A2N7S6A6_9MICC|nr:adenine methyltransferase [Glutamicibacter arilaitensis]
MGGRQRKTRWLTPRPIVEALGEFDLDPCGAPGHELARQTFQIDDGQDGLALPWDGRVWLNPPYGKLTAPFLGKLAEHGTGTALVFARTETKMFFDHVWPAAAGILFMQGRVTFWDESGTPAKGNGGAASVLIAYGDYDAARLKESGLGRFIDLREGLAA